MYQSHNVGDCGFFTKQDRRTMYTSLKAMDLSKDEDEESWPGENDDEDQDGDAFEEGDQDED